tara:strand:+ start:983 stop:1090 length:108 start_codon:yes stop_codon:yes gene_type:complete
MEAAREINNIHGAASCAINAKLKIAKENHKPILMD